MTAPAVRPARQAGRFYPRDPRELKAAVQAMLDRAEEADLPSPPRGLLAPHAGYDYSGPTAARAYKQAARHPWERVVLFAPSHSAHFIGGSIFQGEACATPLGLVPLDSDLIRSLMSHRDVFRFLPETHESEHADEVQLPFLQAAIRGPFRLVPVLIGDSSPDNVLAIAGRIFETLQGQGAVGRTLAVASSDLYHGYDLEECRRSDERFIAALESFDARRLLEAAASKRCMACGAGAVAAAMEFSRLAGATRAVALCRTNSSEAQPRPGGGYVVGYAAAVFC